ncbi:hypothetical protein HHK36_011211 [Tetracentron sinense]|uniref:Uncharacterized protein n=1 Tax=Tetracentron sinense TaxID=13715 RepID=A0A834ZI77_TETSI|nr:hypothetical protein HHK36_011211 [Tetracentron sinense]
MGRAPCCDKANVKKGPWSPEEDLKLKEFIEKYGTGGNWIALPYKAAQESFVGPIHSYQVKDSLLMFGGESSCSSSDGSCNQISYGKEIKQEYGANVEQMGLEGYFYNGVEENQKFELGCGSINGGIEIRPNGLWGETPLDYGIEEIKQLMTSNACNNFFMDHENKTQEKVMYF